MGSDEPSALALVGSMVGLQPISGGVADVEAGDADAEEVLVSLTLVRMRDEED